MNISRFLGSMMRLRGPVGDRHDPTFPEAAVEGALGDCPPCDRPDVYQDSWVEFLSGHDPVEFTRSKCRRSRRRRNKVRSATDIRLELEQLPCAGGVEPDGSSPSDSESSAEVGSPTPASHTVALGPVRVLLTPQSLLWFFRAYVRWQADHCPRCREGQRCQRTHTQGRCQAAATYFGVSTRTITKHWQDARSQKQITRRDFREYFHEGDEPPPGIERFEEFFHQLPKTQILEG